MTTDDVRERTPGLWLLDGSSGEQRVDEAITHLRALLCDPYYFEAVLLMRKELSVIWRRTPQKRGALAAALQKGAPAPASKRGAPSKDSRWKKGLLAAVERDWRANGEKSRPEAAKRVLRATMGSGPLGPHGERELKDLAEDIAAQLRDITRRQKAAATPR